MECQLCGRECFDTVFPLTVRERGINKRLHVCHTCYMKYVVIPKEDIEFVVNEE